MDDKVQRVIELHRQFWTGEIMKSPLVPLTQNISEARELMEYIRK